MGDALALMRRVNGDMGRYVTQLCYPYSCPALHNQLRIGVIRTIRHKGLERLYEDSNTWPKLGGGVFFLLNHSCSI